MKRRVLAIVAMFLLLSGAAYGFVVYVNSPASGDVRQPNRDVSAVKGESISLKSFSTSFFTLKLPDTLRLQTSRENGGDAIYGQYVFAGTKFGSSDQLGVTVAHLNGLTMAEVPFVTQRTNDANYRLVSSGVDFMTFQTIARNEYMTLWLHGDDYVTVVATGGSDQYALLKDLAEQAKRSWQWR